jgi:hypothetical protein
MFKRWRVTLVMPRKMLKKVIRKNEETKKPEGLYGKIKNKNLIKYKNIKQML